MTPTEIIDAAVREYRPSHVFGLFSGGYDSLCACHLLSKHPAFSGVIHINTGIGIEETRRYVRNTCAVLGWSLKEYHTPESYEELVVEYGFPGPGMHWKMYQRLKERCLWQILRDHGARNRKIALVSGRRKKESLRRMANINAPYELGPTPSKRVLWINPILEWSAQDKHQYMQDNDLPKNRVVEILCMSGECLCGAFAKPGELKFIRQFFPEDAAKIDAIVEKVRAGKANRAYCVWGHGGGFVDPNQTDLPLCFSCTAKHEIEA